MNGCTKIMGTHQAPWAALRMSHPLHLSSTCSPAPFFCFPRASLGTCCWASTSAAAGRSVHAAFCWACFASMPAAAMPPAAAVPKHIRNQMWQPRPRMIDGMGCPSTPSHASFILLGEPCIHASSSFSSNKIWKESGTAGTGQGQQACHSPCRDHAWEIFSKAQAAVFEHTADGRWHLLTCPCNSWQQMPHTSSQQQKHAGLNTQPPQPALCRACSHSRRRARTLAATMCHLINRMPITPGSAAPAACPDPGKWLPMSSAHQRSSCSNPLCGGHSMEFNVWQRSRPDA